MKFFLETTKSFWRQLAEDSIKRTVSTLITEGVKGGVEVYKEVYKKKQMKKEEPAKENKCANCKCKKNEDK